MPIQQGYTSRNSERVGYYRWGESGKMYTYEPGDAEARKKALEKAKQQRDAAYASGYDS